MKEKNDNKQKFPWYEKVGEWIYDHGEQIIFVSGMLCGSALTISIARDIVRRDHKNVTGCRIGFKDLGDGIGIGIDQMYKNGKVRPAGGIGLKYTNAKHFAEDLLEAIPKEV